MGKIQYFPAYTCENVDAHDFEVRCTLGGEKHLLPVGKGMLRAVCIKFVTNSFVELEVKQEDEESVVFSVKFIDAQTFRSRNGVPAGSADYVRISGKSVHRLFPFHFAINYEFRVIQIGDGLKHMFPNLKVGKAFKDCFDMSSRPHFVFEVECMMSYLDTVIVLSHNGVKFQGEFVHFPESKLFTFFGAPVAEVLRNPDIKVNIQDLPIYRRLPVTPCGDVRSCYRQDTSDLSSPKQRSSDEDGPPSELRSGQFLKPNGRQGKRRTKSANMEHAEFSNPSRRPRSKTARDDDSGA